MLYELDDKKLKSLIMKFRFKGLATIKDLEGFPFLQIEYLEKILTNHLLVGTNYNDFAILYFELLCTVSKDDVLEFIKKYTFPYDECMALCERNQLDIEKAYIIGIRKNVSES